MSEQADFHTGPWRRDVQWVVHLSSHKSFSYHSSGTPSADEDAVLVGLILQVRS
jgi:hypothetical protein